MIRSMTGFGFAEGEWRGARVTAEVRTVNHRYLELSIRLPRFLSMLEAEVRRLVHARLSRGKVTIAVAWNGDADASSELSLNLEAAGRYVEMLRALQNRFGLTGEVDLATVAARPDVIAWQAPALDEADGWKAVEPLIERALGDLDTMRAREGSALGIDLRARIAEMSRLVAAVEERAPLRVIEYRQQLESKIRSLLDEPAIDANRVAAEVAIHAERLDVTEECVRLKAHNQQFLELLDAGEPAGRKLGFLLQEMNREANTIGSKANDVEIVTRVVALKEEIERIREQVQNVE